MSKKDNKSADKPRGCPGWMMTFGDCMSLLLTFFVMIISFTTFDDIKTDQMLGSFNRSLGLLKSDRAALLEKRMIRTLQGQEVGSKNALEDPNLVVLGYKKEDVEKEKSVLLLQALKNKIKGLKEYDMIDIVPLIHGVSIRIQNAALFEKDKADLLPKTTEVLTFFIDLIKYLPNDIIIEGHTDGVPVRTKRFPSNWDLSAARATAVVNYFVASGVAPERFAIQPMADMAPLILPPDRPKNRRVEIIIKGLKLGEIPEHVFQKKEISR